MYEIKTEILQICDLFNLGSYESAKYGTEINGFIKTDFKTSTGNYTHYFKVKE